jgi:regulator of protease activity HflC (stomatin/prohibitin superfamily)
VEILATVVESIHPPAGAANAYHAVQAAQISAQALIARERGAAADQANLAQLHASIAQDQAAANSREVMSTAQSADLRFSAEQQGYAKAGQAFLLEQYLSQLTLGMTHAKLLVLDHRLGGTSAPTIDLRSFTLPVDPASSTSAEQPSAE